MQKSIYLARLMGPVFAAIGIGMLLNSEIYRIILVEGLNSPILIYITGLLIMPTGIAIVLAHNVWIGDWRLIITLFGWLGAIGGAIRIIYPQLAITVGASVYSHAVAPLIAGTAMLILGFVLIYCGYADEFEKLFKTPARKPRKRSKSS
jgi:cytochrome bd-type quinol oxidase subunit 2